MAIYIKYVFSLTILALFLPFAHSEPETTDSALHFASKSFLDPETIFQSFKDSNFSVRRRDEFVDGEATKNVFQYRVRFKLSLTFLEDSEGKPKLILKVVAPLTGQKFASGWDSIEEINPHIRRLYFDWKGDGYNLQAGAMEVIPPGFMKTLADIDHDGAIKGIRFSMALKDMLKSLNAKGIKIDNLSITAGRIEDDHLERVAFNEGWGTPNYYEFQLQGKITDISRYLLNYSHFAGSQYTDNSVLLGVEVDTRKTMLSFLDKVTVGARFHSGGESAFQRAYVSVSKELFWGIQSSLALVLTRDADSQIPYEDYWLSAPGRDIVNTAIVLKKRVYSGKTINLDLSVKARHAHGVVSNGTDGPYLDKNRFDFVVSASFAKPKGRTGHSLLPDTQNLVDRQDDEFKLLQEASWQRAEQQRLLLEDVYDGE